MYTIPRGSHHLPGMSMRQKGSEVKLGSGKEHSSEKGRTSFPLAMFSPGRTSCNGNEPAIQMKRDGTTKREISRITEPILVSLSTVSNPRSTSAARIYAKEKIINRNGGVDDFLSRSLKEA